MKPNTTITNLIGKIKLQYPEFVDKSGLGYCANASMVLQEELKKTGIEGKLLYGKYLKDNAEGNTAKAHFSNLIKHFPVENAFHGRVKSHFVKNGNKISDKGGHVALLVGDVLYDVTSAQFGLPISYSLDRFLEMWADVHVVDITMKPERTAWNQKVLYTYQTKEKDTVSMESIGTSMGFEEIQPDSVITDIIFKLKEKNNNYSANSGLGYCSEASVALKRELSKIGIDGKLIYGKRLSNNDSGNRAKEHVNNVIKNYVAGPGFYGKIKANYIKNGNKVSEETGHMVVLVKDFVYDVTSAQFGLPVVYDFSKFKDMWDLVQYVDSENTTNKAPDKHSVSVEGLIDITGNVDEQDRIDFNKWFSIQSKQVQANCKIVSSDELGQDYMLHIDKNTPVRFICAMPRSAAHTENNTTARITVAPTLLGCLFGYARYEYDFRYGLPAVSKEKDKYRGGYEICELPFKHCLQPNSKLVYDSEYTGEHWLVTYNKPTLHYTPVKIGKAFIYKMDYKSTGKSEPTTTYEMYVEVHKEDGIKLTPTTHLNKGFHKVVFTIVEDSVNVNKVDKENDLTVTEISSGEYNSVKQLSAAMLSMESNSIPKYLKW